MADKRPSQKMFDTYAALVQSQMDAVALGQEDHDSNAVRHRVESLAVLLQHRADVTALVNDLALHE